MPGALATLFGILAGCAADTHTFVDPTAWSGGEYQDFEPSSAGVALTRKEAPIGRGIATWISVLL